MRDTLDDILLLAARVGVAILFLPSGISKFAAFGDFAGGLASQGLPFAPLLALVAVAIEILAPIAILIGFAPRVTALLLVVFTLAASCVAHNFWSAAPEAAGMAQSMFLKNMAIIAGLLFYAVVGAGRWAVTATRASIESIKD